MTTKKKKKVNDLKRKHLKIANSLLDAYLELLTISGQQINSVFVKQPRLYYFPTVCEFICDIEIAARECLSESELEHFNKYIKNSEFEATEQIRFKTDEIKVKLGRVFLYKKLYPVERYTLKTKNVTEETL